MEGNLASSRTDYVSVKSVITIRLVGRDFDLITELGLYAVTWLSGSDLVTGFCLNVELVTTVATLGEHTR